MEYYKKLRLRKKTPEKSKDKKDDNETLKGRLRKLEKENQRLKSDLGTTKKALQASLQRISDLTFHKNVGTILKDIEEDGNEEH